MNKIIVKSFFLIVSIILFLTNVIVCKFSQEEFKDFLKNIYEPAASELCSEMWEAYWNFSTDGDNKEKENIFDNAYFKAAKFDKEYWEKIFRNLDPNDFDDKELKQAVSLLKNIEIAALPPDKIKKMQQLSRSMTNIYNTAKICPYNKPKCNLTTDGLYLKPKIVEILSKSTDYDELLYVWKEWRDATGAKMKDDFQAYVDLSNEEAKANNFSDKGELWKFSYDMSNFTEEIEYLWNQVKPLYTQLHKYVARKLKNRFGDKLDISDGLIPAHVLGNMWAQEWTNLTDLVKPYPTIGQIDITSALKEQNYTVLKMFEIADEFYQSLGLLSNGISYDTSKGAIIEKPTDGRKIICDASTWDLCDGKNYRIKMCASVNFEDFLTIHQEMGNIQYYLQYSKQPFVFRHSANPAFPAAIGDTIALSVATPRHLKKINLLDNSENDNKSDLNSLMSMALKKIAFLPFGLLVDKWRWDVFSNKIRREEWNSKWWEYRELYQKVKAPITRSDEHDFDPGAKYHVPGDLQYIRYFIEKIIQFQLYKSLCMAAGQYEVNNENLALHKCDFYQSKAAGTKLKNGLSLGSSKHWTEVLEVMTGEKKLNASAILEYFKPLYEFLLKENEKN